MQHIYITLKGGQGDSLGSRAPRTTYYIPLEPSGPRDSREPSAPRKRVSGRTRQHEIKNFNSSLHYIFHALGKTKPICVGFGSIP